MLQQRLSYDYEWKRVSESLSEESESTHTIPRLGLYEQHASFHLLRFLGSSSLITSPACSRRCCTLLSFSIFQSTRFATYSKLLRREIGSARREIRR